MRDKESVLCWTRESVAQCEVRPCLIFLAREGVPDKGKLRVTEGRKATGPVIGQDSRVAEEQDTFPGFFGRPVFEANQRTAWRDSEVENEKTC